jgi:aerobic carbon-monoxide dehydrogenase large subunit
MSRFEDARLVRGGGRYVDDMVLPGMAFGYVLRSPHAHAYIRAIEVTAAKAAPGVLAVLTGADWRASGWGDLPVPGGLNRRDGSAGCRPRYPALVLDRARCVGDGVAFVVAETYHQAADAVELMLVDYERLPTVTSTALALAGGALWYSTTATITFASSIAPVGKAATDAAFAGATHVVRQHFVINRVTAVTMERRGSIGDYNAADGRYTVYTTLQHRIVEERTHAHPSVPRRTRPADSQGAGEQGAGGRRRHRRQLRDEVRGLQRGGAGAACLAPDRPSGQMDQHPLGSIFVRCPGPRQDHRCRTCALDADGTFLGLRVKTIANMGANLQTAAPAFVGNLGTLADVHRTPAIHADVTVVFTNTNPVRPYRGNGRPEAAYLIERLVDPAAGTLGIDPAELRRRNTIRRRRCRSAPDSASPMTAANLPKISTLCSGSPTPTGFLPDVTRRVLAASCAGSVYQIPSSAPAHRAMRAPRSGSTEPVP